MAHAQLFFYSRWSESHYLSCLLIQTKKSLNENRVLEPNYVFNGNKIIE